MSQVKLEAKVREKTGKGVARKLRREGRVPAVLYGHHMEAPISLDLDAKALETALQAGGRTAVFNLTLTGNGGGRHAAMVADYQRDVFGTCITHVDFKQVALDEMVTARVPISLTGTSKGVKLGGVLEQILREVEVQALPLDVPDALELDVTDLDVGEHVTIGDLKVPGNVTVGADAAETVAVVHSTRTGSTVAEGGGSEGTTPEATEQE